MKMALKDLLTTSKKNDDGEYYWSVVIEPGWVQAGIWTIVENQAKVTALSPVAAWETEDDLIGAADTALSSAVQNLPEEAGEPSKTVFGVPSSWVSEGKIKDEYLEKIKTICTKLSLIPSGFVILPEAIAHYMKVQEGTPLNAVVVGLGRENIELVVFKLGNLLGTTEVARSVSIADDVSEGLVRFGKEDSFPSRFILYDAKEAELDEARQSLLKAEWDLLEIKFLHTPKVEIISPEKKVLAVCLAGASEVGEVSSISRADEEVEEEVRDEEVENVVTPETKVSAEDLGFVIGADIAKERPHEDNFVQEAEKPKEPDVVEEKPRKIPKANLLTKYSSAFKKVSPFAILGGTKKALSTATDKALSLQGKMLKRTFIFGGVFFLLLLLASFLAWWYLPKATVTVFVAPKKLDEKVSLSVDTDAKEADFDKGILTGEVLETNVSGEKTRSTSGTKTVGERAKGTVRIRNGTVNDIKLASGGLIIGPNELEFTLDAQASVSAALSPSSPGTAEVNVTAKEIGAESNLGKDETFSVGNFAKAEVDAVATSDFSGGSSRQISVVSLEDQEDLDKQLTEELMESASTKLPQGLSEDKFFVSEALIATPSAKTFSGKVGDEADNVKLSLTLDVSGLSIPKTQLIELAKRVLQDKAPSGYVLREEQVDYEFDFKGVKGGTYELEGFFITNFLPETDTEKITQEIKGKYPDVVEDYLTTIAGFTRAEISLKPHLPGLLGSLPRVTKNIDVEVAAER